MSSLKAVGIVWEIVYQLILRRTMVTGAETKMYRPETSNIAQTAVIGTYCTIHSHVWIGEKVRIGDDCKIQAFAFIPTGVTIGNKVFIGPHVCFTNDKNPPSGGKNWANTLVKDRAVIGANSTILPGITIGEGAVIGAGSVVTKDVPDGETWYGNPARKARVEP